MSTDGAGTGFELGTDGPRCILVGCDGTDTAMRAAAYAAGLARRQGARLVVLFVVSTTSMSAQTAATAGAFRQTQDELVDELRSGTAEFTRRTGVDAELVVRCGNPYKELVAIAHELRVDGVVVGASTQAGHRLVGSLAGRLVRDAAWPVTVVP